MPTRKMTRAEAGALGGKVKNSLKGFGTNRELAKQVAGGKHKKQIKVESE
jgi:hypothetical protein